MIHLKFLLSVWHYSPAIERVAVADVNALEVPEIGVYLGHKGWYKHTEPGFDDRPSRAFHFNKGLMYLSKLSPTSRTVTVRDTSSSVTPPRKAVKVDGCRVLSPFQSSNYITATSHHLLSTAVSSSQPPILLRLATASLAALVSAFTSDCTLISVRVLSLLPVLLNSFICITVTNSFLISCPACGILLQHSVIFPFRIYKTDLQSALSFIGLKNPGCFLARETQTQMWQTLYITYKTKQLAVIFIHATVLKLGLSCAD